MGYALAQGYAIPDAETMDGLRDAAQLVPFRDSLRRFIGADYERQIAPNAARVRAEMRERECGPLDALRALVDRMRAAGDQCGWGLWFLMAATVEVSEANASADGNARFQPEGG